MLIVTRGYGNGTFDGAIPQVVTRGYIASFGYVGTEVEQNDAAGVPKRTSFYAPTIDLLREDDELLTIIMGYFK